jgi:hypothetical protein
MCRYICVDVLVFGTLRAWCSSHQATVIDTWIQTTTQTQTHKHTHTHTHIYIHTHTHTQTHRYSKSFHSILASRMPQTTEDVRLDTVCCLLSAVCCLLPAVCCLLSAVCCQLSAACCLLSAVCRLLSAVCCLLFVRMLSACLHINTQAHTD